MTRKLTDKQKLFVQEYLVDLNATRAAARAGYSAKTSEQLGHQLLKKAWVRDAIQVAMDQRSAKIEITSDAVLQELAKLAFVDIRELFDDHGRLLPPHQLPDNIAPAISSVEVTTSRIPDGEAADVEHTSKIRLWDKKGSLELLGKHLKLFADRVEHDIKTVSVRDFTGSGPDSGK